MQTKLLTYGFSIAILSTFLCNCVTPTSTVNDPLCARITQKLDQGAVVNNTPSPQVITATDRSRLLQEYNHLGCHLDSDNRFAYPYTSLPMNKEANNLPANQE